MKLTALILATVVLFAGCRSTRTAIADDSNRSIEYHVDGDKYAVVIVKDGLSESEAREMAMQKAADMTVSNGYRYFTVESQSEVSLIKSDKQYPSQESMPRNIYYELIQSGNFGREPIRSGDFSTASMATGYKVTFTCSKERSSEKALDACSYTSCDGE